MSKQRRYFVWASILVACVGVAFTLFVFLPPRPGVTKDNFDRIQDGMKIEDVEAILGSPAQPFHGFANRGPTYVWQGDDGSLAFVEVADESIISRKWRPSTESIADKIRRWLGLQK